MVQGHKVYGVPLCTPVSSIPIATIMRSEVLIYLNVVGLCRHRIDFR